MRFAAGTMVHTNNGLKPIELVCPGDRVLSTVKGQANPVYQRVLRTLRETRQAVCWVRAQGHNLIATRSHPKHNQSEWQRGGLWKKRRITEIFN